MPTKAPKKVDELRVADFRPCTWITIFQRNGNVWFVVADPQEAVGLSKPAIDGQRGAGYRDVMARLGTRPYVEGRQLTTTNAINFDDTDVEWGVIAAGRELVLRHVDTNLVTTLGCPIEGAMAR